MTQSSVTIVVVPREKFSRSQRSLESIYRHTNYPFDLVYVDGNSPPELRHYLQQASVAKGFRLIRSERFLSPNEARNLGRKDVHSRYVVFVDNDLEVEPDWLGRLVRCAEETGAWAVGPLYLEGAPKDQIIHMFGGMADFLESENGRDFHEEHIFNQRRYPEVSSQIRRTETGSFEFHCVLMPLQVLDRLGPLDEGYPCNHEHLDASLLIRQAGGTIYIEPEARVTYTDGLLDGYDLDYVKVRWSDEGIRQSTRHFVEKWRINEKSEWIPATIRWANAHREHLIGMRRSPANRLRQMRRTATNLFKRHAATNILTKRAYARLREARSR